MSKHTPGPWKAFNASWSETFITAPTFDHGICCLDINHATEETQADDEALMAANARLIAAAPELLSNLRFAVDLLTPIAGHTAQVERMRAAIAKATGA